MLRLFTEGVGLFLLPFVLYVGLLVAQRRFSFVRQTWNDGSLVRLAATGLSLAILGLLALGFFGERHRGAYVPAHIDHGRFVPGQMQ